MAEPEKTMTTIQDAFPGDTPPPQLGVAIVSLVELCQHAMPDPEAVHKAIEGADFLVADQTKANAFGRWLALDNKVFSFPVRNMRHKFFSKERKGQAVMLLVSEGESDQGKVIFCSTMFWGVIEADMVKAAAHVTKKEPLTGARVTNSDGDVVRRVFWDTGGVSGVRGFVVTGPDDIITGAHARAFTAFNVAGKKAN
jgi:hypothetical protein